MFIADFLYVNYVFIISILLSIMLTEYKYLTLSLNFRPLFDSYIRKPQENGSTKQNGITKTKKK